MFDPKHLTSILGEDDSLSPDQVSQLMGDLYHVLRSRISHLVPPERGAEMGPTDVLHEAVARIMENPGPFRFGSSRDLYAFLATVCRRILVDAARQRSATKRRHGARQPLDSSIASTTDDDRFLLLDELVKVLEERDPDSARLVVLRVFGGSTTDKQPR